MASTDDTERDPGEVDHSPASGARRGRRLLHAIGCWLPIVILSIVVVGAAAVVVDLDAPPAGSRPPASEEPVPDTPVLSLRRSLGPVGSVVAEHRLRTRLDAFVATQPPDTCLDVDVDGLRYRHRTDDPQAPASLQKLLVAAAALLELGPDHRYETEALAVPPVEGRVDGNLHLRGGGDPVLATAPYMARERNQPQVFTDLDRLADEVVAAGVREVAGSVVGDEARYDTERYHPAWPRRFLVQGQIGPLSALSVNDAFSYYPDVLGAFGAAEDPAAYAATVLTNALRDRGVVVGGEPASGPAPEELPAVATLESPPLREIVGQMLRESDNNTAELLVKELGLQRGGAGTFAAGQVAVTAILADAGLATEPLVVVDGSGLALDDVVSCGLVVDVLDHPATADVIAGSLPVAGESGTLVRRWVGTPLQGRVRAKTGTLNQVTALAGLAETDGGGSARFALVVNLGPDEFVTAEMVQAQERLAEALVTHPAIPDLTALRPVVPVSPP